MKANQNNLVESPHNTPNPINGHAAPCKVPWCNREATTKERCDIHTEVHEAYTKAKHEPYSAEEADAEIAVQAQSNETRAVKRKIVFEHDTDPDFSWLDQDMYDPSKPGYEPIYRSQADMKAKRKPIDGNWYRDPENHIALSMLVFEMSEDDEDWQIIDSLGSIDFLTDSSEVTTGTFYNVNALPKGYLRDLAKEAGLKA